MCFRLKKYQMIFSSTGVRKVLFLVLPHFCDQLADTSLDIAREKRTGRFYIVGSDGFDAMH